MPEILEIEVYRRAAEAVVGRTIVSVGAPDAWYLKGATNRRGIERALSGRSIVGVGRRGKLLLLDIAQGPTVGIRFGMTGRLVVDDAPALDGLEYSSSRLESRWDRFTLSFGAQGSLRVNDPRRLGGVELAPAVDALGPDALSLTSRQLRDALDRGAGPLKARLMDQARIAGLGNLLVDEILWRAGLSPTRPAGSLSPDDLRLLHRHIRSTLTTLGRRGGSHTGDLQEERSREGVCPRDGTPLQRRTVGGRTTYSCPRHQQ